jgi:hypothetical protein
VKSKVVEWNDIPPVSQDYTLARRAIVERVTKLVKTWLVLRRSDLKLEIQRELNAPRPRTRDRLQELGQRHTAATEYRVDLSNVRTIQQVKCFGHL